MPPDDRDFECLCLLFAFAFTLFGWSRPWLAAALEPLLPEVRTP